MRRAIIALFTIINILSCKSQNENKMDEIINEITNQLITYSEQPSYNASINSSACSFEFLVNDMPVLSYYNIGGVSTSIPINPQILRSGAQRFKLKIYPGYYRQNKELIQTDSLTRDTKLNLSIIVKDWNNLEEESKTVLEFTLPSITSESGIKEFELAGTPYFEYKGTFNADVPYSLNGWSGSVDLTREDHENLEKEVIETYRYLIKKFDTKDAEGITIYSKDKITERLQSLYSTEKSDVLKIIYGYSDKFTNSNYHTKALENYKMYIFGNGKIVCLLRTDIKNKGEGVVRVGFTNEEDKKRLSFYGFMFHRPTEGAALAPIR